MTGKQIRDAINVLQDVRDNIREELERAMTALREVGEVGEEIHERAFRYWAAHIQGALGKSDWIGGSMVRLNDTIKELKGLLKK